MLLSFFSTGSSVIFKSTSVSGDGLTSSDFNSMSLLLRDLIIPAAGPLFFREFEVLFELRKIVETKNDFFFREIELLLFLWSPLSWSSSKLVTEIVFRESENLWIFNYRPIDCRMWHFSKIRRSCLMKLSCQTIQNLTIFFGKQNTNSFFSLFLVKLSIFCYGFG